MRIPRPALTLHPFPPPPERPPLHLLIQHKLDRAVRDAEQREGRPAEEAREALGAGEGGEAVWGGRVGLVFEFGGGIFLPLAPRWGPSDSNVSLDRSEARLNSGKTSMWMTLKMAGSGPKTTGWETWRTTRLGESIPKRALMRQPQTTSCHQLAIPLADLVEVSISWDVIVLTRHPSSTETVVLTLVPSIM